MVLSKKYYQKKQDAVGVRGRGRTVLEPLEDGVGWGDSRSYEGASRGGPVYVFGDMEEGMQGPGSADSKQSWG